LNVAITGELRKIVRAACVLSIVVANLSQILARNIGLRPRKQVGLSSAGLRGLVVLLTLTTAVQLLQKLLQHSKIRRRQSVLQKNLNLVQSRGAVVVRILIASATARHEGGVQGTQGTVSAIARRAYAEP